MNISVNQKSFLSQIKSFKKVFKSLIRDKNPILKILKGELYHTELNIIKGWFNVKYHPILEPA